MTLALISPNKAAALINNGATLIDIRPTDEFKHRHIEGAINQPVGELNAGSIPPADVVIFTCQSGMRTQTNAAKLAAAAQGSKEVYILEGGVGAWQKQGLPVNVAPNAPALDLQRQVQVTIGALVILGVVLGTWVNPGWYLLSAFVGAGLLLAGLTGFCGLARLLMLAPWNKA